MQIITTITPQQLHEEAKCQHPDCDGKHDAETVVLHAKCHPGAGMKVSYDPHPRVLMFQCHQCGSVAAALNLSPEASQ